MTKPDGGRHHAAELLRAAAALIATHEVGPEVMLPGLSAGLSLAKNMESVEIALLDLAVLIEMGGEPREPVVFVDRPVHEPSDCGCPPGARCAGCELPEPPDCVCE